MNDLPPESPNQSPTAQGRIAAIALVIVSAAAIPLTFAPAPWPGVAVMLLGVAAAFWAWRRDRKAAIELQERWNRCLRDSLARQNRIQDAILSCGVPTMVFDGDEQALHLSSTFTEFTGHELPAGQKRHIREFLGQDLLDHRELAIYPEGYVTEVPTAARGSVRTRCLLSSCSLNGGVAQLIPLAKKRKALEQAEARRERILQATASLEGLAHHLEHASHNLTRVNADLSETAATQKDRSASAAASMTQMTQAVLDVAQNASATAQAATSADDSARKGANLMRDVKSEIHQVAAASERLAQNLQGLDSRSEQIGRIIGVIDDIADQTNLLALNAAIEAARAGDAGRGFAVVADEVRKLAEKTLGATKEVKQAVTAIQQSSKEAVIAMDSASTQVRRATELAEDTSDAFSSIQSSITDVAERLARIAAAAEEQSTSAEEVERQVEEAAAVGRELDDSSQRQAEAIAELERLLRELNQVAENLGESEQGSNEA